MATEPSLNRPVHLLRLLGTPQVEGPEGVLGGPIAQRHRIALLALLAVAPRGLLPRERLVGLLWPESKNDSARDLLNAAVHAVRRALGEDVLISQGLGLGLDPSRVRIDVHEFEAALKAGDAAGAVDLYTGPFLDGLALKGAVEFEHWQERERDRLERLYHSALEQHAENTARLDGPAAAVGSWRRRLACTPTDGRIVARLMHTLAEAGDRAGALQVASVHATLLRTEFESPADPAIQELAEQVRRSGVGTSAGHASHGGAGRPMNEERPVADADEGDMRLPPASEGARSNAIRDSAPGFAGTGRSSPATETNAIADAGGLLSLRQFRARWLAAAATVAMFLALGAFLRMSGSGSAGRTSILLPDTAPLAFVPGGPSLALSPDGSTVVYVAQVRGGTVLYRQRLDESSAFAMPGTEGATQPFFSPDGRWVGFFSGGYLRKLSIDGGSPVTLAEASQPYGASWWPGDSILVAALEGGRPMWVSAARGVLGEVARVDRQRISYPVPGPKPGWILAQNDGKVLMLLSPDTGAVFLFTRDGPMVRARAVQDRRHEYDERVIVGSNPRWLPSGHIIYMSHEDGVLMAFPFDAERLLVLGPPVPVLDSVRTETMRGAGQFSVARNGTLVFAAGRNAGFSVFVWRDRSGRIDTLAFPRDNYGPFDLHPDGRRIVALVASATGPYMWPHVLDIERVTRTRVPAIAGSRNREPRWWHDSMRVAFASEIPKLGIRIVVHGIADTTQRDTTIVAAQIQDVSSACGLMGLMAYQGRPGPWLVPLDTMRPAIRLPAPVGSYGIIFSPDCRWAGFTSGEPRGYEIFAVEIARPNERVQVSASGGLDAVWSPTGELTFRTADQWFSASAPPAGSKQFGAPQLLFEGEFLDVPGRSYDISPDGQRFLLLQGTTATTSSHIHVITDWADEVRRAAPMRIPSTTQH